MTTPNAPELTTDLIRRAPKVLLHDHLDGGLRPRTILELAAEQGYDKLPATTETELSHWFVAAADSRSLERYLETFAHTTGVMQTADALTRIAAECAEDLSNDGVVYAEVRFAPEQHQEQGLSLDQVVEAVVRGFALGEQRAAAAGRPIIVRALLCAMRQNSRGLEIAELTTRFRDRGVAGFDIAGPEIGFPPTAHQEAFDYLRANDMRFTVHAGEADGLQSMTAALHSCGASRFGHGVRLIDDITAGDDGLELGRFAAYVRDSRVTLEMCPTSNVQTGGAASIAEHPIGLLSQLRFRVTVNTDNRLMSGCSMTSEMAAVASAFGFGWDQLEWLTLNAMKAAFLPFDHRLAIIYEVIKPGYAALRAAG